MKRSTLILLVLTLAGGLFIRTYQLSERGLLVADEAGYFSASASAAIHARWWLGGKGKGLPADAQREKLIETLEKAGAHRGLVHQSKPLYGLLVILVFTLFGLSPQFLFLMNATLGAATVGIMFWLALRLGRTESGALLSALALAVSGFHLIWSRSGFSQASATFFLVLGLACYAQAVWGGREASRRWLAASGLGLGAGFAMHPVVGFYVGVCFLVEGYRSVRDGRIRHGLANLLMIGLGFGVVLSLMQLLTWSAGRLLLPDYSWIYGDTIPTYLQGLLNSKWKVMESGWVVDTPRAKLSGYVLMPFLYGEGAVISGLALVGFGLMVVRFARDGWSPRSFFLLAAFGLPLLLFATVRVKPFPRNIGPLAPVVALLAGVSLESLWARLGRGGRRWAAVGLFLLIQYVHMAYLFDIRSGFASAKTWLNRKGGKHVVFLRPNSDGSLLYSNGFRDVYHAKWARTGEVLEVVKMSSWKRAEFPPKPNTKSYAGVIGGSRIGGGPLNQAWVSRFDFSRPVASFPNPRAFTLKKIELLRGIQWLIKRTGSQWMAVWVKNELGGENRVMVSGTIHLYRMRTP
jgi:hypothetical protein